MKHYTYIGDPETEELIEEKLKIIKGEILKVIKPDLILLSGSLGRGEGTAKIKNGEREILSDFEIYVVAKNLKKRKVLALLSKELSEDLGVSIHINLIKPIRLMHNQVRNLSFGHHKPSIVMYEIKEGSKTLFGNVSFIMMSKIKPESIPVFEGILLVLNRMAESLIVPENKKSYFYDKLAIACGDTLLLVNRMYHYSYFERLNRLEKIKQSVLSDKEMDFIKDAYKRKIFSIYVLWNKKDVEKIMKISEKILNYAVYKELSFSFNSYREFAIKYLNNPKIKKGFPFYKLGFLTTPLYENLIHILKLRIFNIPIPKTFWKHLLMPWQHIVYSVVPLLFQDKFKNKIEKDVFLQEFFPEVSDLKNFAKFWYSVCVGMKPDL